MPVSSPSFVSCTCEKARLNMSWKMSRSVNGEPWRTYIATYQGIATARITSTPVMISRRRSSLQRRFVATYANAQSIGRPKPAGPLAIVAMAAHSHAAM